MFVFIDIQEFRLCVDTWIFTLYIGFMAKKAQKPTLNPADVDLLIGAMKVVFPAREEVKKIVEETIGKKTKFLPTKEEFFARMDKLSREYEKIDQAETLHAGAISEHTDTLENHDERIKVLERRKISTPASII